MALFYNKVERGNPQDLKAPKKWYISLKTLGLVREKEIGKAMADETTLNPKEAEMALYQAEKVIAARLLDGHTVELGELGSFRLTVNSKGADKEEEATAQNITKVNIRFTPSKAFREQIKKATFTPVSSLSNKSK
jgi:predicted histone-like DNA-binding protein